MKLKSLPYLLLAAFSAMFISAGAQGTASTKKSLPTATRNGEKKGEKIYDKRYLYVATPGIRNYLGYGGHGILVFDMDNNHQFVKRIQTQGMVSDSLLARMKKAPSAKGAEAIPSNVKGI